MTRIITAVFLLSLLVHTSSQAADDLDALRTYLANHRAAEAWALAEKLEPQRAGHVDFDFLYAQAALATRHPNQAIFALERIRLQRPQEQGVRVWLVRAQLEAGDAVRARIELDALLASNPTEAVRVQAQKLSAKLPSSDISRPVRGFVGFDIGYDSNVNSATDAISITGLGGSPTSGIVLAPGDRAQQDSFARLSGGYGAERRFGKHLALFADAMGYTNTLYDQTQFNTTLYQGRVGAGWQMGAQRWTLPLSRQVFYVDHRRYSIYDLAGLEWSYTFNATQRMMLAVSRGQASYVDQPTRDTRITTGLLGWMSQLGRTRLGATIRYGQDDPRVDFNDALALSNAFMGRHGYTAGVDARYRWRPRHTARAALLFQSSRYDASDPSLSCAGKTSTRCSSPVGIGNRVRTGQCMPTSTMRSIIRTSIFMIMTGHKSCWERAMISIKTVKKSRAGRVSQTGRIILSGLFLLGVGTPVFAEPVGKVLVVTGTAQAQAATGPVRVLVPGAPLERGDSLITAADSNLQVRFVDGALLMVRPNSRIRIDDYRAEGNNLHSVMSLLVGGIRSLTGRIGKTRRDEYLMNTSTASIGVRGTDYELRLCQGDCPAGSADGLYLGVMDGGIVARNDAGAFDLNAHEYGLIRNHKAALEKLDCPPEALTGVPCTARGATSSMDPGMGYRAGENLERDGLPSAFSRGSLCAAPGPPNCDPQITASCVPLYPSCQ